MLSVENHAYFHRQPPQVQKQLNEIFQEYKRQVDECNISYVDDLDIPYVVVPVEFYVDEKGKYNRAKKKQEDRKMIDKYYEEER